MAWALCGNLQWTSNELADIEDDPRQVADALVYLLSFVVDKLWYITD